jgi:hypothetical protein
MRIAWLWLAALPFGGCAKKAYESPAAAYNQPYGGYYGGDAEYAPSPSVPMAPLPMAEEMDDSRSMSKGDSGGGGKKSPPKPSRAPGAPPPPPPPPPPDGMPPTEVAEPTTPDAPAAERMIHYEGWGRLKVPNPRETLDAVVALAETFGGRTEQLAGNTVSIRVPVLKFEEAWDAVLALGDVMDRSVRADDVTEAFTAIDLRARTLRATQQRLVELLARAREEEEKLVLLQELTRVSEELDAIESQLRTLSDLADMSRITVEAVAREAFTAGGGRPELDGFGWIGALSPFRRYADDPHRVELPVPDGLVALTPRGPFVAESPEGTVLWTQRVPNDPLGAGAFWIAAVEDRLAEEFATPVQTRLGEWDCLSVDEPGADEPYHWQICVKPRGRRLEVAQVYYPSPEQLARYGPGIDQALASGGGGS